MIVQSRDECQEIYKKMDFDVRYGIAANPTMDKFFRKLGLNRLYNKHFELCMKSSIEDCYFLQNENKNYNFRL